MRACRVGPHANSRTHLKQAATEHDTKDSAENAITAYSPATERKIAVPPSEANIRLMIWQGTAKKFFGEGLQSPVLENGRTKK